jgi:hypothetical protein
VDAISRRSRLSTALVPFTISLLLGVVLAQNQPGPFTDRPYAIFLAQVFAFWGR